MTPTRNIIIPLLTCICGLVICWVCAGCTTRNYYIYQNGYGENRIDAEVLKEMDITPTVKASLK